MGSQLVTKVCDLCGQPASRIHPALCAECYYKFWERVNRETGRLMAVW